MMHGWGGPVSQRSEYILQLSTDDQVNNWVGYSLRHFLHHLLQSLFHEATRLLNYGEHVKRIAHQGEIDISMMWASGVRNRLFQACLGTILTLNLTMMPWPRNKDWVWAQGSGWMAWLPFGRSGHLQVTADVFTQLGNAVSGEPVNTSTPCFKSHESHASPKCGHGQNNQNRGRGGPRAGDQGPAFSDQRVRSANPSAPRVLEDLLVRYDQSITQYLWTGFTEGFWVGFQGDPPGPCKQNLLSEIQKPEIVSTKLNKEIELGRILGPHHVCC